MSGRSLEKGIVKAELYGNHTSIRSRVFSISRILLLLVSILYRSMV